MADKGKLDRSFFTTQFIEDGRERVHAWRESAGFIFDVNPHESIELPGFYANIESYNYGSLVTSVCQSRSSNFVRSPIDAAVNGVDHFLVQVYLAGSCNFTGDAQDNLAEVGDIFILDATRLNDCWTTDFKNFTLWVPRLMLEAIVIDPDALHGRVIKASTPMATLLRTYLLSMHEQASMMGIAEGELLTDPTLDLLSATLKGVPDNRPEHNAAVNAAVLIAVKKYINNNLEYPDLSPDTIARAINVSRAKLYRICEPLGGVQNYIRQQRLRRALKGLVSPGDSHLSIAQIGARWGFEDSSSFTRAFRREFGLSPKDARNQNSESDRVLNTSDNTTVGDRHYENWLTELLG